MMDAPMLETRVELLRVRCPGCGTEFAVPKPAREDVMACMTPAGEIAAINMYTDHVFDEVVALVKRLLAERVRCREWEAIDCFESVFGWACDVSPAGFSYDFKGKIWCLGCKEKGELIGPYDPPRVDVRTIPLITHHHWESLDDAGQRSVILSALEEVGCL